MIARFIIHLILVWTLNQIFKERATDKPPKYWDMDFSMPIDSVKNDEFGLRIKGDSVILRHEPVY